MAIIAVFSGSFCHGEEVAGLVADRLGYSRLEDRLLEETSRRYGISRDNLEKTMTGPIPFLNRVTREREKNTALLRLVLSELIQDDDQLLFGYAVHFLPDTIPHVLKACVIANFDYRVEQVLESGTVSEKDAEKLIRDDDEKRLGWTGFLFDRAPYAAELYDIVVPMQETSPDEAADIICTHAASEQLATTDASRRAAEDFMLSSAVTLALVKKGHDNIDVRADKGHVYLTINEYVLRLKHLEEEISEIAGQVSGVREVTTRTGPGYRPPSANPWANIETPPKVLLVDDEKDYVHTLSERLLTRDIGAAVVYDGEQALEFVERDEPDVMVLDLMMPGIDGIEVLRRIKQQRPHIEVIILTGHGSEREQTLAEELGAFAYLKKPVDVDDLARIMRDAYDRVSRIRSEREEKKQEGQDT